MWSEADTSIQKMIIKKLFTINIKGGREKRDFISWQANKLLLIHVHIIVGLDVRIIFTYTYFWQFFSLSLSLFILNLLTDGFIVFSFLYTRPTMHRSSQHRELRGVRKPHSCLSLLTTVRDFISKQWERGRI